MPAFYNELEPYAVQWLRNLSDAGHIADGTVDARSIVDVEPSDLAGFAQCHFFAGIGAWSHALRLAGWPDAEPVWTGSCPCQPFSVAGKGEGEDDSRHLWPQWFRLIEQCRPTAIFGEQVTGPAARSWLSAVSADLEAIGYRVGAADLCAAGVGAPHRRQRLYFVAYSERRTPTRYRHDLAAAPSGVPGTPREQWLRADAGHGGAASELADSDSDRRQSIETARLHDEGQRGNDADGRRGSGELADPAGVGCTGRAGPHNDGTGGGAADDSESGWVQCSDGKARPLEPGIVPMVDGFATRVGRLRAYGNAIVPQVAAAFIQAARGL